MITKQNIKNIYTPPNPPYPKILTYTLIPNPFNQNILKTPKKQICYSKIVTKLSKMLAYQKRS